MQGFQPPYGFPGQMGPPPIPHIPMMPTGVMQNNITPGSFMNGGIAPNASAPWAISREEKQMYDATFRAWDPQNKGFLDGQTAIVMMTQSGLDRPDLERIWALSDPSNRGKLNMDEFAVAMHLINRKLHGFPVPLALPPELIPPSQRALNDSIGTVKSLLSRDAESRKTTGAFLQPQGTGVSYMKEHSFKPSTFTPALRPKDATMYKNNDDMIGYRSGARRRPPGGAGRTSSPATSAASERSNDDLTVEELKKKIRESKIMLEATDFEDQKRAEEEDVLNRKDRRDAENLMDRIRRVQDNIDDDPKSHLRNTDTSAERRALRRELQSYQDQLPELASNVRKTEKLIAETRLEIFRLKDQKAHPDQLNVVGTGPGGTVTEADRIKARARARMQARAAELAGRPAPSIEDDGAATRRLEEERVTIDAERARNENMTRGVEESVKDFSRSLEDGLRDISDDSTLEHERRRWEEALGVEDVIRDLIFDLQRNSRVAKYRTPMQRDSFEPRYSSPSQTTSEPPVRSSSSHAMSPSPPASLPPGTSPENRVLSARERAQKRIAERMASAGIKPVGDDAEVVRERQEKERREREERTRLAEEEDARREAERQTRLARESPAPPPGPAKGRPPPPPPKSRAGPDVYAEEEARRRATEQRLAEEEKKREEERQTMARKEEENLTRRAEEDRRREQVRQQNLQREAEERRLHAEEYSRIEEERRRQSQQQEEERQLAQENARKEQERQRLQDEEDQRYVAEEARRQREEEEERRRLSEAQRSMPTAATTSSVFSSSHQRKESWETSSSESSTQSVPAATGAELPAPPALASAPPAPAPAPAVTETAAPVPEPPSVSAPPSTALPNAAPAAGPTPSSNNPFHRLAMQNAQKPKPPPSTAKDDDDGWSAAGSEDSSDEDDRPGAGSAAALASLLFDTMGPPPARPTSSLSGQGSKSANDSKTGTPVSPPHTTSAPPAPPAPPAAPALPAESGQTGQPPIPPPPPPVPAVSAPTAPVAPGPPPPPPAPAVGQPSAPAMPGDASDRGGLMASIRGGAKLKKTQTNDRSASSVAGRAL